MPRCGASCRAWSSPADGARMQFDGVITSWNDARGFGFIEPLQGGDPVFVHIKAFQGG
ncbi:cold shock domain-containing protein, partial [Paracidovorax avenae]|uniref:cold shock domain-containing protein n=1 Tax=Paracidovorax avenae TaxID=80867 RepID=UPI0039C9C293